MVYSSDKANSSLRSMAAHRAPWRMDTPTAVDTCMSPTIDVQNKQLTGGHRFRRYKRQKEESLKRRDIDEASTLYDYIELYRP